MTEPIPDNLVSIIGSSYFQPIADLMTRLSGLPTLGENDVQVSSNENGYSASIVLLLVSMFESYVMRVRYINRDKIAIKQTSVTKYLQTLYADFPQINQLIEVFALRNSIAHNHLWEIDFTWNDELGMNLKNASLEETAGNADFHNVVDESTRKTKLLALNIVPIKVGRGEVRKVFNVIWDSLIFLEGKNRNQCYVSHLHVTFGKNVLLFSDLVNPLNN